MQRRLVVAAALALAVTVFSQAQSPFAAVVEDGEGQSQVWVFKGGKPQAIEGSEPCRPLSWSPDGRWLVLGVPVKSGWNLRLVDTSAAQLVPFPLTGACSLPSWSPAGKSFVAAVHGSGLRLCDVTGSDPLWKPLTASGDRPAWSPSGGRIAFVGPKGGPGGWIVDDDGGSARSFYKPSGVESAAWAPDGRTLAMVVATRQGRQLMTLSPSGGEAQNLGKVDSADADWSPDGRWILVRQSGAWNLVSPGSARAVETGVTGVEKPQWLSSKSLAVVRDGSVGEYSWDSKVFTPWRSTEDYGRVVCASVFRGLVLEGTSSSGRTFSLKPKPGQVSIRGTVKSVEFESGVAEIAVWSVLSPDGMELNLARPLDQSVQVTSLSTREGPQGNVRLKATEMFVDGEFLATVRGDRAGVPQTLDIEHSIVPELLEVSPSSLDALAHPVRTLDPDGVSVDHVVVPMAFPVLGEVTWSDTFLADRSGGARRHHGQDLMAPKMRALVAAFDGTVRLNRAPSGHRTITLRGDDGWTAVYMHVNNDTPGTDDGQGGDRYAFAPGLRSGDRVVRGQLIGFCGDSGNAEGTASHCHFELHDSIGGGVLNAAPSLAQAERLAAPVCVLPESPASLNAGEHRWDIVVSKVDKERGVIVGELLASGDTTAGLKVALAPRLVYVKTQPDTIVAMRHDPTETRAFSDLKTGQFLTVVGSVPGTDKAMEARHVGVGLGLGQ